MSSHASTGAYRERFAQWRAVWVVSAHVEETDNMADAVRTAGRSLGLTIDRVAIRQRHVIVDFAVHGRRNGEAAADMLKAKSEAHLAAGERPAGRWWCKGLYVTRI